MNTAYQIAFSTLSGKAVPTSFDNVNFETAAEAIQLARRYAAPGRGPATLGFVVTGPRGLEHSELL